ncbi:hypothetical protein [Paracerasibacillus soli]|uniref:Uncharacterized protein n=2 Tax=Paracerasibacillus soli TaxID=480284 RepID=A0ABU5CQ40_9BACI|nr:hypothetical protein [Virgibacillus soli]MDY0407575.1 hypothetical protein [Virgibacillus soli]
MRFFNLSFSLPTTFKSMVEKQITKDKQIDIKDLDMNKTILNIRIEKPFTSAKKIEEYETDDNDIISTLLNNELRFYKGGRFKESNEEYDLYIYFESFVRRYTVSEDYIKTFDGIYKILDKENDLYESLKSLYNQVQ